MSVTAIVLASGCSKRMQGHNKLLLPFHGVPLVQITLDCLRNVDAVLVVTPYPAVRTLALSYGYQVIDNPCAAEGMSASIRLGVAAAQGDHFLFCCGDQPFLDAATVQTLLYDCNEDSIHVPTAQGTLGAPTVFPKRYAPDLLLLSGEQGGRIVMARYPKQVKHIPIANHKALLDIDTYEQLLLYMNSKN